MAVVGLAQVIVQALAFAAGILVIRSLDTDSYALYSLAYSILGMMSVLADSGITSGGMSEAGKVWQDPARLGQVVATILALRRKFAIYAILLSGPLLVYMLHRHGANWPTALLLTVLVVFQFQLTLQSAAYAVAPALHQLIAQTQRIAVVQNAVRVLGLGVGMWAAPNAVIALVAAIPAQIWNFLRLKRLSGSIATPTHEVDLEVRSRVLNVVRKVMPGAVYYALSGQLTVWLISIFGDTKTLAEVGALSRLSQILTVISSVFAVVLVPRFARLESAGSVVLRRYFQILALAGTLGLSVCGLVAVFPDQALWILGHRYQGLEHEVLLQSFVGVMSLMGGLAYQLGSVRSIVIEPLISIPAEILFQVALIRFFSFHTASGVLCFAILNASAQAVMHIVYFTCKVPRR